MKENIEIETNKQKNNYKISTIILAIITIILLIINITQSITYNNRDIDISYNGMSYNDNQVYINILIENNSLNEVFIAYNNFSIKSENSYAITPDTMYYLDDFSTMHQDLEVYIYAKKSMRIKLNYDKDEIPLNASLYFNGKKLTNL